MLYSTVDSPVFSGDCHHAIPFFPADTIEIREAAKLCRVVQRVQGQFLKERWGYYMYHYSKSQCTIVNYMYHYSKSQCTIVNYMYHYSKSQCTIVNYVY